MEKPIGDVHLLLDEVGTGTFCGVSRYTLRGLRRARRLLEQIPDLPMEAAS